MIFQNDGYMKAFCINSVKFKVKLKLEWLLDLLIHKKSSMKPIYEWLGLELTDKLFSWLPTQDEETSNTYYN